jgi:hypothetical protein
VPACLLSLMLSRPNHAQNPPPQPAPCPANHVKCSDGACVPPDEEYILDMLFAESHHNDCYEAADQTYSECIAACQDWDLACFYQCYEAKTLAKQSCDGEYARAKRQAADDLCARAGH